MTPALLRCLGKLRVTKIKSDAFVLDRTSNEISSHEEEIKELETKVSEEHKEEFEKINQESETKTRELRKKEIDLATRNKELELIKKALDELSDDIAKKEKTKEDRQFREEFETGFYGLG